MLSRLHIDTIYIHSLLMIHSLFSVFVMMMLFSVDDVLLLCSDCYSAVTLVCNLMYSWWLTVILSDLLCRLSWCSDTVMLCSTFVFCWYIGRRRPMMVMLFLLRCVHLLLILLLYSCCGKSIYSKCIIQLCSNSNYSMIWKLYIETLRNDCTAIHGNVYLDYYSILSCDSIQYLW